MALSKVDGIQYMQTVRDNADAGSKTQASAQDHATSPASPNAAFTSLIDPPRNKTAVKGDFESDDDMLLTTSDDDGYMLSTSSSSDDEEVFKKPAIGATGPTCNQPSTSAQAIEKPNALPSKNPETANEPQSASDTDKATLSKSPGTRSTFMDVLNEILTDPPEVPQQSKLGPKPWLMKQGQQKPWLVRQELPKAKNKYAVSMEPFIYKPKPEQAKQITQKEVIAKTVQDSTISPSTRPCEPIYAAPQLYNQPKKSEFSPKPALNANIISNNVFKENKKSPKQSSETDTGFGSNTSSNPSPSNSSRAVSRLPSNDEFSPISNSSGTNAQELARAALQALSVSKNILQNMENGGKSRETDSIYDEVPFSPVTKEKKNVYEDVPLHSNDATMDTSGKRTVISVPIFQPPPPPMRNNKDHPISSEPIYDISRSNMQTPTNVSSGTLDLMYQLFGRDLSGTNNIHSNYGRPSSVKSVTFEDEIGSQGEGSRPPSRAGSLCSEWSDCTLNISEYPESEATTLPRTTIDFPSFPQVGFQNTRFNHPDPLRFPFPPGNFNQNQPNPIPNYPYRPPVSQPYPVPQPNYNSMYGPRPPLPTNGLNQLPPPRFPNSEAHSVRSPIYAPRQPYPPFNPYDQYPPRPPSHAFSPPRSQWGGFSPPSTYEHRHHHHHRRGRTNIRRRGRKTRSYSRGRKRDSSCSDDDYYSRSPSPPRHHRRDPVDPQVIAGKSYIDGYKAALKDAVLTFAEKQMKKKEEPETAEEQMRRTLRRALSAGKIHELPDNVELGDIRKAFATKSHSDDELDVKADDLLLPSSGRPTGSFHEGQRKRRRQRHNDRRHQINYEVSDDETCSSDSYHGDSCDCSECEEETEMRTRFHEGELMPSRPKRYDVIKPRENGEDNVRTASPRMEGLRQRFIESLEESSGSARAPVRAHLPLDVGMEHNVRSKRAEARRRQNFEEVCPRTFKGAFRPGRVPNYHMPNGPMTSYYSHHQPRAIRPNDWRRSNMVHHGYQ